MSNSDSFETQRDVVPAVEAELETAGFDDAHEIGRGGFGVVYRCRQTALDRRVAVKVLTNDFDVENRKRFIREGRAMGRLTGHPNIVGVLHVGITDRGRPYVVMQYHERGSLDDLIRRHGPLSLEDALRVGVKLAGALETAHRQGVIHRDVKPANILFTHFGEPALTDFGIAHIAGGFETETGIVTGSPAFTAPEVLAGQSPSQASDIYGLGATLFCAITGHAAFERRSGEQLVAQFVRITTEPIPDLREQGIAGDVASALERAMSAQPGDRHATAAAFGRELQAVQAAHGFPADTIAIAGDSQASFEVPPTRSGSGGGPRAGAAGNLPIELTSFVGRRHEVAATKKLLASSRLVTLTGIGGVGKTRLALRVATAVHRHYIHGAWLVELGELADGSLLAESVAAVFGLRDHAARPTEEALVALLSTRELLLILDNCEQVVDAVVQLSEKLLRSCPGLRILATSREALEVGGEALLRVPPLTVPDPDNPPTSAGVRSYDAVSLFIDRAVVAEPTFTITDTNRAVVAQVCHHLEGLPLAIELAAARLRALTPDQILQRLTDRYALLTRGARSAPPRQQSLRLCIDWSYELCTPQERLVWSRLSVFAGSVDLEGAEQVCGEQFTSDELLDVMSSLVDKSILMREEQGKTLRFRLLETLREYGQDQARDSGEYLELRRRHLQWYRRLSLTAEAEWISANQLDWIDRIEREQTNLREALQFSIEAHPESGLRIAGALYLFWSARGMYSEGRFWLDRLLDSGRGETIIRARALYAASALAGLQGDLSAGAVFVDQLHVLEQETSDPVIEMLSHHSAGLVAFFGGDLDSACALLERSCREARDQDDTNLYVEALLMLGLPLALTGQTDSSLNCYKQVLDTTEAVGESVYRAYALWAVGVDAWRSGSSDRATALLSEALPYLGRLVHDPVGTAMCLEALAWLAADSDDGRRAALLLAAASTLGDTAGSSPVFLPNLIGHHDDSIRYARQLIGDEAFDAAYREGKSLSVEEAIRYALEEPAQRTASHTGPASLPQLTRRERQVAELVAEGLTNRQIATRLTISPRTAQGHVEHVLTKLGFVSRAQIAAWIVERPGENVLRRR
ncbi:protein kinase domain-containing protein [Rhodococcus koreensis]